MPLLVIALQKGNFASTGGRHEPSTNQYGIILHAYRGEPHVGAEVDRNQYVTAIKTRVYRTILVQTKNNSFKSSHPGINMSA
ncbi:hypothetical protein D3C81_1435070 [compost metagenome]